MRDATSWRARCRFAVHPRRSILAILSMLCVAALAALPAWTAAAAEPPEPPRGADRSELAARGSVTYRVYCQSCHGAAARGDGQLADYLDSRPADLTRIATEHDGSFPVDHVYRVIDGREEGAAGRREMPVWGEALAATDEAAGLPPREIEIKIWGLVYYVESLQR